MGNWFDHDGTALRERVNAMLLKYPRPYAQLARESGLNPNTVRKFIKSETRFSWSTYVCMEKWATMMEIGNENK